MKVDSTRVSACFDHNVTFVRQRDAVDGQRLTVLVGSNGNRWRCGSFAAFRLGRQPDVVERVGLESIKDVSFTDGQRSMMLFLQEKQVHHLILIDCQPEIQLEKISRERDKKGLGDDDDYFGERVVPVEFIAVDIFAGVVRPSPFE